MSAWSIHFKPRSLLSDLLDALHRFAFLLDSESNLMSDFWFSACPEERSMAISLPVISLSMSIFSSTLPTMVNANKSAVVSGNIIPEVMLHNAWKKSTECYMSASPDRLDMEAYSVS
jgi:hypothetical protein